MRQKIIIIGAGMAGLLAANILRRHEVQVVERQTALPNNHHAVLRFRSTRVSDACHIPFRKVKVFKACDEQDPIRAAMLYAKKVTGRYEVRSLINLEPCERWIAPPNLIQQMEASVPPVAYGVDGSLYLNPKDRLPDGVPIVSTLPMPVLMDLLEYEGPRPDFTSREGFTLTATIAGCDIFATRYYARGDGTMYRASITGNRLILEFVGAPAGRSGLLPEDNWDQLQLLEVARDFGVEEDGQVYRHEPMMHQSRYAKLAELSTEDRRKAMDFMFWASTHWNVYSLGRFATWRPGLLLDDVVDDVLKIERWIGGGNYDLKKGMHK